MAKKSFYVFLTALLGVLLFLILHRIVVFLYLYLLATGYVADFDYWKFLVIDYSTLFLTMMLGAWYGIWLGMNWFKQVYEEGSHGGLAEHLARKYWPGKRAKNLNLKLSAVKERLETDLWQLEDLAKTSVAQTSRPVPKVRKMVRKIAPKKLNSLK